MLNNIKYIIVNSHNIIRYLNHGYRIYIESDVYTNTTTLEHYMVTYGFQLILLQPYRY